MFKKNGFFLPCPLFSCLQTDRLTDSVQVEVWWTTTYCQNPGEGILSVHHSIQPGLPLMGRGGIKPTMGLGGCKKI